MRHIEAKCVIYCDTCHTRQELEGGHYVAFEYTPESGIRLNKYMATENPDFNFDNFMMQLPKGWHRYGNKDICERCQTHFDKVNGVINPKEVIND